MSWPQRQNALVVWQQKLPLMERWGQRFSFNGVQKKSQWNPAYCPPGHHDWTDVDYTSTVNRLERDQGRGDTRAEVKNPVKGKGGRLQRCWGAGWWQRLSLSLSLSLSEEGAGDDSRNLQRSNQETRRKPVRSMRRNLRRHTESGPTFITTTLNHKPILYRPSGIAISHGTVRGPVRNPHS
jgi:hypothetical protein